LISSIFFSFITTYALDFFKKKNGAKKNKIMFLVNVFTEGKKSCLVN